MLVALQSKIDGIIIRDRRKVKNTAQKATGIEKSQKGPKKRIIIHYLNIPWIESLSENI